MMCFVPLSFSACSGLTHRGAVPQEPTGVATETVRGQLSLFLISCNTTVRRRSAAGLDFSMALDFS